MWKRQKLHSDESLVSDETHLALKNDLTLLTGSTTVLKGELFAQESQEFVPWKKII